MRFTSAEGGAPSGPTSDAKLLANNHVAMFFAYLPIKIEASATSRSDSKVSLSYFAEQSNIYAQESVKKVKHGDGAKKKSIFVSCASDAQGARRRFTPDNTQDERGEYNKEWEPFTPMSILVFLALLLFQAVTQIRNILWYWSPKYGRNVPWVQNSITQD
eukprot:SAG11_NODE_5885_length_1441_cov_1.084948_1_plen_159_part_10